MKSRFFSNAFEKTRHQDKPTDCRRADGAEQDGARCAQAIESPVNAPTRYTRLNALADLISERPVNGVDELVECGIARARLCGALEVLEGCGVVLKKPSKRFLWSTKPGSAQREVVFKGLHQKLYASVLRFEI